MVKFYWIIEMQEVNPDSIIDVQVKRFHEQASANAAALFDLEVFLILSPDTFKHLLLSFWW